MSRHTEPVHARTVEELNLNSFGCPVAAGGIADTGSDIRRASSNCRVRIHVLGQFMILRDGWPLAFGRKTPRKPLDLLKMLIASGGRRADTNILSEELWPDSDGDAARKSFDINLHRLRKVLGVQDLLALSGGKLSFDSRNCWIDVWEFEDLLERIEGAISQSSEGGDAEYASLASALLRVYTGHFLEHETPEAWAVAYRDRLRAKFVRAVMALAVCLEQHRKWDQAAALYSRALELDNLAESLYRRLMICYRELGETADALSVYRRCRDLLSIVFSIKPSAETEAIRSTLRGATE
jgi:DNA-binding SARP family transcriptional activator